MPLRDPTLQHQVILENPSASNSIVVSCNCRWRAGVEPIAEVRDYSETVEMYNDPNHHVEPFGKEWMLNGQRGQGVQQGTTQATSD